MTFFENYKSGLIVLLLLVEHGQCLPLPQNYFPMTSIPVGQHGGSQPQGFLVTPQHSSDDHNYGSQQEYENYGGNYYENMSPGIPFQSGMAPQSHYDSGMNSYDNYRPGMTSYDSYRPGVGQYDSYGPTSDQYDGYGTAMGQFDSYQKPYGSRPLQTPSAYQQQHYPFF